MYIYLHMHSVIAIIVVFFTNEKNLINANKKQIMQEIFHKTYSFCKWLMKLIPIIIKNIYTIFN